MLPLIINNFASTNRGKSNYPTGSDFIQTNLVRDYNAGNLSSYPGSGSTWTDLAGSGYNLTLYNSPTTGSNYIQFDGVDDFASGSDAGMPSGSNARTMYCWIYPLVSTDFKCISDYGKSVSSQAYAWFQINGYGPYLPIQQPSHGVSFYVNNSILASSNGWLNTNKWSLITFSNSGNSYRMYLNGCLFTSGTASSINTVLDGVLTLATDRGKTLNFNCRIGRWSMYNVQHTNSQVQTNWFQTKDQYDPINLEPGITR